MAGISGGPSSAVPLGCVKLGVTSAWYTLLGRGSEEGGLVLRKSQEYYITPTYIITYCIMPGTRPCITQLLFLWHFADNRLPLRDSFALCFRSPQLSLCRQTGETPCSFSQQH